MRKSNYKHVAVLVCYATLLVMLGNFAISRGQAADEKDQSKKEIEKWTTTSIRENDLSTLEMLNRGQQYPVCPMPFTDFGICLNTFSDRERWNATPSERFLQEVHESLRSIIRAEYLPPSLTPYAKASKEGHFLVAYIVVDEKGKKSRFIVLSAGKFYDIYIDSVSPIKSPQQLYNVASECVVLPAVKQSKTRDLVKHQINKEFIKGEAKRWGRDLTDSMAEKEIAAFPETVEVLFSSENIALRGGRISIVEDKEPARATNAISLNIKKK